MSENIISHLKNISLFKDFADNDEYLNKIMEIIKFHSCKKNTEVIREGEQGDSLYILHQGSVHIEKMTQQGDRFTVATLSDQSFSFFGELSLVDEEQRSASVVTETDCKFLTINRADFLTFGDRYPEIGLPITRQISRMLSSRMRKANNDIITLFDALVQEIEGERV